ncbi:MAG: 30S ribosomal protein S17 [Verrucomicrobiales bacterium]|nr:30S ribosomal protein S17 [Verrucomicrobiales bacterium]
MSETQQHSPQRKERTGQVVSDKMAKTIVVRVERRVQHPQYHKVVRRFRKFHAHDEQGLAKVGDWVRIVECRPLSKMKCWRLVEVLAGRSATPETAGE